MNAQRCRGTCGELTFLKRFGVPLCDDCAETLERRAWEEATDSATAIDVRNAILATLNGTPTKKPTRLSEVKAERDTARERVSLLECLLSWSYESDPDSRTEWNDADGNRIEATLWSGPRKASLGIVRLVGHYNVRPTVTAMTFEQFEAEVKSQSMRLDTSYRMGECAALDAMRAVHRTWFARKEGVR